jgi:hypothetical protein
MAAWAACVHGATIQVVQQAGPCPKTQSRVTKVLGIGLNVKMELSVLTAGYRGWLTRADHKGGGPAMARPHESNGGTENLEWKDGPWGYWLSLSISSVEISKFAWTS